VLNEGVGIYQSKLEKSSPGDLLYGPERVPRAAE